MTPSNSLFWDGLPKPKGDLTTARLLIEQEKQLLDVAAYHCQQTAGKSLKAWLTLRVITHELSQN